MLARADRYQLDAQNDNLQVFTMYGEFSTPVHLLSWVFDPTRR